MTEPSRELLIVQVEAALELGDLEAAERMMTQVESRFADEPTVVSLRRRIAAQGALQAADVAGAAQIFTPPPDLPLLPDMSPAVEPSFDVQGALNDAQAAIQRADYTASLNILNSALTQAPHSAELREMLEPTQKAAKRHEEAVARHQAMHHAAEEIEQRLEEGSLVQAKEMLEETVMRHGWAPSLEPLRDRLEVLGAEAQQQQLTSQFQRARTLFEGRNPQEALDELQAVLKRQPSHAEARDLERRIRDQLDREESRRQRAMAIDQARHDIERLISAGELGSARGKLEEAVGRFGAQSGLDELAKRLEQARATKEADRMLEWSKRRANEAETLVREAGRLSLKGDFQEAVQRLQQAKDLNPNHPEIPGLLTAAQNAIERHEREKRRQEALGARRAVIQRLLDGLQLESAAVALKNARDEFGDEPSFTQLEIRLRQLHEVEGGGASPGTDAVARRQLAAARLARQQELAQAYTWKQTLFFPLRGRTLPVFAIVFAVLLALEMLVGVPWVGVVFAILRGLAPVLLAGLMLEVARATVRGKNDLPEWDDLLDPQRWRRDARVYFALLACAAVPLLGFVLSRELHGLLDAESGLLGWAIAALLIWAAAAVGVLVLSATAAFGDIHAWRFAHHLRALRTAEPDSLWAIHLLYGLTLLIIIVRTSFAPLVPWQGIPLAVALEVYALLVAPHLIGVVVRRHGAELSGLYR